MSGTPEFEFGDFEHTEHGSNGIQGVGAVVVKLDSIAESIEGLAKQKAEESARTKIRLDKHSIDLRGLDGITKQLQLLQGVWSAMSQKMTGIEVKQDQQAARLDSLAAEMRAVRLWLWGVLVLLAVIVGLEAIR